MKDTDTLIARWETRGNDYLNLFRGGSRPNDYFYRGNGCGGVFAVGSDADAIARMEALGGPAFVLKLDRPSLRRVS